MSIHDDNKAWFEGFIGAPRKYLSSFSEHLSHKQGEEARGGTSIDNPSHTGKGVSRSGDFALWKGMLVFGVMIITGVVAFLFLSNYGVGTGASLTLSFIVAFMMGGAALLSLVYIWTILFIVFCVAVYRFVGPLLHG